MTREKGRLEKGCEPETSLQRMILLSAQA